MFRSRSRPAGPSRSAEDFDLLIWRTPEGYRARVREPESGREAHADFSRPFSAEDLEGALGPGDVCRDLKSPQPKAHDLALKVGLALFEAVFVKEILVSWRTRLREAESARKDLRLRLHLDSPELWDWPWELLHDPLRGFLASLPTTLVVRYVEMSERIQPLRVRPPIRVLAVAACPAGFSALSVQDELADLESSLANPRQVELDRLEGATRDALRRKLQEKTFHVLHFIGHGTFDEGGGVVLLEREGGEADRLGGRDLSVLLQAHPQLRLVVLNLCQGARGGGSEPFAGVAQSLIKGRLPAVVAMRSAVTDRAAILFSRQFYESLARREPVDRAVARARHAMFTQESAEWGSPVLAMRSPDGRLFDLFWWEILADRAATIASTWRHWLLALALLIFLAAGLRTLGRRWFDPNLFYAFLNPPECPSPAGLSIAFVKVDPGPPLRPFCLGRFEVTQRIWKDVMGKVRTRRPRSVLPVVRVSWEEATGFLAELERREPRGRFRLPTEAEWESAARPGETDPAAPSAATANCADKEEDDGYQGLAPVGSFRPNARGLYDMLGNVSEWVSDLDGSVAEPKRIRLGGSFSIVLRNCSSYRSSVKPDVRYDDTGFRIVRETVK